jgi:hypothetical protein
MRRTITTVRMLALGVLLLAGATVPARAGPPPIGTWVSARGAGLVVTEHATCEFVVPTITAAGECIWRQSPTGGILMIKYQATAPTGETRDQLLYLDIRWVNQLVITVTGEVFRRTR